MKRSNAWVRRIEQWILQPIFNLGTKSPPGYFTPIPKKILICKTCCLGDAVISLYAIRAYKLANPETRIEILCSDRIREVYQDSTYVSAVHSLPITGHKLLRELLSPTFCVTLIRLLFILRQSHFDWYVDLEVYRRYGPGLKRLLGIPYSRGFHVEGLSKPNHEGLYFRRRLEPEWHCFFGVFGMLVPSQPLLPLYASPQLLVSKQKVGIVFGSSFNWPEKKWPLEYFAQLINLFQKTSVEFVLFGTTIDDVESQKLIRSVQNPILSTVGSLNFLGLKHALQQCALVVGNDTGTMHVAAACGIKTLTIFGPTPPQKWTPMNGEAVFLPEITCRPCYYLGTMPDCSHRNCLKLLNPERIAEAMQKLLSL